MASSPTASIIFVPEPVRERSRPELAATPGLYR
jgi:hypothetical protein